MLQTATPYYNKHMSLNVVMKLKKGAE